MKKLALAPVVALAITGLAASPVIATPSTQAPEGPASIQQAPSPADASASEGTIAVSSASVTTDEFADPGVGISGAGLAPDAKFTMVVTPTSGQNVAPYEETVTTDETGAFETGVNSLGTASDAFIGGYSVTVTNVADENETYSTNFEVTAGGDETEEPTAPAVDPKASLESKEISAADLEKWGLTFTGEGFTPGGDVSIEGVDADDTVVAKADDKGNVDGTFTAKGVKPGKYTVTFIDDESGEKTEPQAFTVVEDATETPTTPAAEAKLIVSPESVTPKDFVQKDKGVKLVVENCEPGEDVRFVVNPKGNSSVTAFDETEKADDEGNASVTVYGTSASNPSAYIGDYDVTVTCGDDELTGKFSVEEDPNAGGSDGNDDGGSDGGNGGGNGGGDLPRTGMELTGLAAGAGLLLVGGTAIFLTKRRKKGVPSPSDI
ncbi:MULTISPECIES: LPXTG cell wall anchor domain-containing protein [unclassified Brevibacterium]|uniref:LPXTG cell wall anchor domain-containing protein n=1 Tax=unclassified Brevibacterium TaxID=2614124 RepID=UPI0010F66468|nr:MULTISPECIES: LPXTG cell wall anchor domain-containing protein [unclassified Brevibacterium]MCM1011260.1 LPXTG cell wall anchor domain-containing protein [Brevibacterium sp. XM4083]